MIIYSLFNFLDSLTEPHDKYKKLVPNIMIVTMNILQVHEDCL